MSTPTNTSTNTLRATLLLVVDGATEQHRARGIAVAKAVLEAAGVTPYDAAAAHFVREGWDVRGFLPVETPDEALLRLASVWDEAEHAAVQACCAGWNAIPSFARLELRIEPALRIEGSD